MIPCPKLRPAEPRDISKRSALLDFRSSRPAEPTSATTSDAAGISTPARFTPQVVTRGSVWLDPSKRSISSTDPATSAGSARNTFAWPPAASAANSVRR